MHIYSDAWVQSALVSSCSEPMRPVFLLPMLLWIIATYITYTVSLCRETNNFSCLRLELPKGTILHIYVKFRTVMITYLNVH